MEAAWPGLAVEESNLTVQIAAFGERWIETLPRRGYRFVGPTVAKTEDGGVMNGRYRRSLNAVKSRRRDPLAFGHRKPNPNVGSCRSCRVNWFGLVVTSKICAMRSEPTTVVSLRLSARSRVPWANISAKLYSYISDTPSRTKTMPNWPCARDLSCAQRSLPSKSTPKCHCAAGSE
jgi:hypothetical protein